MIPVKVDQLFLSNMGFVVLLKGDADERSLPIFIGAAEAQAIALWLNKVKVPRPLTHDLLKNTLDFLECRLARIEVCELKEGTFFARLVLIRDGREMAMDSRPSDAIALALRCGAPILVDQGVMAEAGRVFEPEELQSEQAEQAADKQAGPPKPAEKKHLTPLEALEQKLARAVEEERYEDAARLRDEINRLKHSHSDN